MYSLCATLDLWTGSSPGKRYIDNRFALPFFVFFPPFFFSFFFAVVPLNNLPRQLGPVSTYKQKLIQFCFLNWIALKSDLIGQKMNTQQGTFIVGRGKFDSIQKKKKSMNRLHFRQVWRDFFFNWIEFEDMIQIEVACSHWALSITTTDDISWTSTNGGRGTSRAHAFRP